MRARERLLEPHMPHLTPASLEAARLHRTSAVGRVPQPTDAHDDHLLDQSRDPCGAATPPLLRAGTHAAPDRLRAHDWKQIPVPPPHRPSQPQHANKAQPPASIWAMWRSGFCGVRITDHARSCHKSLALGCSERVGSVCYFSGEKPRSAVRHKGREKACSRKLVFCVCPRSRVLLVPSLSPRQAS